MTDMERFDAIYREYRPKVSGYIGSHVSDPEDAEDLCSEVFRKVLEHLADHPSGGVSSFIYTVTRNTVVDYYRTRRVHAPLEEDLPEESGLEESVLNSDALRRLAGALRRLPQRERDIVVLHYYQGRSLQEIAGALNLPYGTAKRAHQAALMQLRGLLGEI